MRFLVLLLLCCSLVAWTFGQTCPDGSTPVNCNVDPCSVAPEDECPDAARCVANYCGGCNRDYYDGDGKQICNGETSSCSDGSEAVYCFADPCSVRPPDECPEAATCVSNYCGGCNREYYDRDGNRVCSCRDASNPVECFADPCSVRPDNECPEAAMCVSNYCGGCNREYYDREGNRICNEKLCNVTECGPQLGMPNELCWDGSTAGPTGRCLKYDDNTCGWEVRACPPQNNCSDVMCALYCPYGFVTDEKGCPTCQCVSGPCPDNSNALCAPLECPEDSYPAYTKDSCCPKCVPYCDPNTVVCAAVACDEGYHREYAPGECCGHCVKDQDCDIAKASFLCPEPQPPCKDGYTAIQQGCCKVCEPVVNCAAVLCRAAECGEGEKAIVRPGDCCPTCQPIPDCSLLDCPQTIASECPTGSTALVPDLQCCSECFNQGVCDAVRCASPACPEDQWIKRQGECCYQCPLCMDSPKRTCNWNDDPVCTRGFWKGPDCTVEIPIDNRVYVQFEITVCTQPECTTFTEQQVKMALANKGQVPPEHITVQMEGEDGHCCVKYTVTIADENSETSIDVEEAKARIFEALANDPIYQVQKDQGNTANSLAISSVLMMAAAFLAF